MYFPWRDKESCGPDSIRSTQRKHRAYHSDFASESANSSRLWFACERVTMHAMPADVATPVHEPHRLTFKRVLLALLLGLAAWWGVGWWLSPRALYTLRFANTHDLRTFRNGFKAFFYVSFDPEFLVIHHPNVESEEMTLEWFDLLRGTRVKEQTYSASRDFSATGHTSTEGRIVALIVGGPFVRRDGKYPPQFSWVETTRDTSDAARRVIGHGQSIHGDSPNVLAQLLPLKSLTGWGSRRVGIWEEDRERFLWSTQLGAEIRDYVRAYALVDHDWVVFHSSNAGVHEVSVFKVPLSSYSPWWPRSAGLLAAAFVLFAHRRSRGLLGAYSLALFQGNPCMIKEIGAWSDRAKGAH